MAAKKRNRSRDRSRMEPVPKRRRSPTTRILSLFYDVDAAKRTTSVSINSDLLRIAKESGLNVSQVLEERLIEMLKPAWREAYLAENAGAIESYNRRVSNDPSFEKDVEIHNALDALDPDVED